MMQAKDWTLARAVGTAGASVKAKAKTVTGTASHKNGKARTDRMIGARQHGKARAARRGASSVLTKPVRRITVQLTTRRRNSLLHAERE